MSTGTLTLFCGKMGAAKSTLAKQMAKDTNALLLIEDDWFEALYANRINTVHDYVEYSNRLKLLIKTLVQSLLLQDANVIMDFPVNTKPQRQWLKTLATNASVCDRFIYVDCSDSVRLEHIQKKRLQQSKRAMFEQIKRYFEAPSQEAGFAITTI